MSTIKKKLFVPKNEQAKIIGNLIEISRKNKKLTATETAIMAGVSRGLLSRIEKGDLKCSLDSVLEVAKILELDLFNHDLATLPISVQLKYTEERISLLPKTVRNKEKMIK